MYGVTEPLHLWMQGVAIVIGVERRQAREAVIDPAIDSFGCHLGGRSQ